MTNKPYKSHNVERKKKKKRKWEGKIIKSWSCTLGIIHEHMNITFFHLWWGKISPKYFLDELVEKLFQGPSWIKIVAWAVFPLFFFPCSFSSHCSEYVWSSLSVEESYQRELTFKVSRTNKWPRLFL